MVSWQIVPGSSNGIAIELVTTHLRRQLAERALSHRKTFAQQTPRLNGDKPLVKGSSGGMDLPDSVTVLKQTSQLQVRSRVDPVKAWTGPDPRSSQGIHTLIRDQNCTSEDFIHHSQRLSMMIIETALQMLPYRSHTVSTRAGYAHEGKKLDAEVCSEFISTSILLIDMADMRCLDLAVRTVL